MHLKPRTWFIISILCFLGAGYFWKLGDEKFARENPSKRPGAPTSNISATNLNSPPPAPSTPAVVVTNSQSSTASALPVDPRFPLRLTNTKKPLRELMHIEQALMLRNALLDTREPLLLAIPPHLKAAHDAGSYVVQARGVISESF